MRSPFACGGVSIAAATIIAFCILARAASFVLAAVAVVLALSFLASAVGGK